MGNKCAYKGCKTGFELKKNKKNIAINTLRLFSFPQKDPDRAAIWEKYTGRDDLATLKSKKYLCELHFETTQFDPDSKLKLKLKPNAIPTVDFNVTDQSFTVLTPNKGEHFMDIAPKASKLDFHETVGGFYPGLENEANILGQNKMSKVKFESSNEIVDFIKSFIKRRPWSYLQKSSFLHKFAFFPSEAINEQSVIVVILDTSIDIKQLGAKSIVSVFSQNGPVNMKSFVKLFKKPYIPQSRSEVQEFLLYLEDYYDIFNSSKNTKQLSNILSDFDKCSFKEQCQEKVAFLRNQLSFLNVPKKSRRYSHDTLLCAYDIYISGTKAYEKCRNVITLPSVRTMRRLSEFFKPDPTMKDNNLRYLKEQFSLLKEHERYITLKIDEVSIKPSLDFQGEQVFGYAENTKNPQLANSCQAFMICSLFSKYQEMARLVPVRNQTHPQLKGFLFEVLDTLIEAGFVVLAITSDNHTTNRALFFDICNSGEKYDIRDRDHKYFKFEYKTQLIHCFFDAPHMFKCIRNNWINLSNSGRTFYFPEFQNLSGTFASFDVIKDLYESEKCKLTKFAVKLNVNTIYPSNFGRQNVQCALNIFDPTTSSGLIQYVGKEKTGHALSTANFLQLFNSVWEVLNIKTPRKGYEKRIKHAIPFSSSTFDSDFRIDEINRFIDWLCEWEAESFDSNGKLTNETFHALILTLKSLLSFVYTMFKEPEKLKLDCKKRYLMPGKLQTDMLEQRFGTYRGLNGSAYLMSIKELNSSERKVRIRTRIKLGNITFSLEKIDMGSPEIVLKEKGDLVLNLDHILDDVSCIESLIAQCDADQSGAVLYISGAIAYRLKKTINCISCFQCLIDPCDSYEVESESELDYFDSINRGGLLKPSLFLFTLIRISLALFEVYIRPELGYSIKNPSSCQLREIFFNFLNKISYFSGYDTCDLCKAKRNFMFKGVLKIFTNICLNNFCKLITDIDKLNDLTKRKKNQDKKMNKDNERISKDQKLINIAGKL